VDLRAQLSRRTQEHGSVLVELESAQTELRSRSNALVELEQRTHDLDSIRARAARPSFSGDVAALQDQLEAVQEELVGARAQLTERTAELDASKETATELQAALKAMRGDMKTARQEFRRVSSELHSLQRENTSEVRFSPFRVHPS
jgi:chromosome segregation ATPase